MEIAMEQDDEEFEKLLGEIPRATSAPPHLEELQQTLESQSDAGGCFLPAKEEGGKPTTEVSEDELYEDFYRPYSGGKSLSPHMEGRTIYNDIAIISPKSSANQLSSFCSGLSHPLPNFHLPELELKQEQSHLQSQRSQPQQQRQHQLSLDASLTDHLARTQSQQFLCNDHSLSSAFANLTFGDSSARPGGVQPLLDNGGANASVDHHRIVVGLHSDCVSPPSSGLYSHLNANSSAGSTVVPASMSSLDAFSQNVPAARDSLCKGFMNGLHVPPLMVGQTSPGIHLPSNERFSSLDVHDTGFPSNIQSQQQHRQNFDAYSVTPGALSMQSGRQYPNGNVSGNEQFGSPSTHQIQYPVDIETPYFVQLQQRMQAAAASHTHVQVEEERVQNRQLMRQQLILRQQQLQEQQARFYASLQARPMAMGSAYTRVQSLNQIGQQAGWNPALGINFYQQQPIQRLLGGLNFDDGWKHQHPQGSLAAAALGFSDPPASQFGNICRYYSQGFCSRGETCPFLHIQTQSERVAQSNSVTTNGGLTVSSRQQFHAEKNMLRKSPRGVPGVSPPGTILSSASRRKDAQANGRILSNGNPLTPHSHSDLHTDEDTNAWLNTQEHLDRELPRSTNMQHHFSQHQQSKYSTLEEVAGRIYTIAKDQHGCRFLQRKFEEGAAEDVHTIFVEIIDHIIDLMTDPFGNYLIQKLLEVCNEFQRMEILQRVTGQGQLVTISLNMHGTRAVQKLIETLKSTDQVAMVISSLQQGVVTLIKDLNGNHVIQRCLQRLGSEDSQFIFDAAASHCIEIASHRHGCCVLQRCVDFSSGVQRQRLVAEIASNALVLSQDPFGNYVVQYILDLAMPWAAIEVISRLEGNFACLSMQKFSSNVVEKCLKLAGEDNRAQIVRELMSSSRLGQLLQDPYANYVVQSALTVSKGGLHASLIEAIRPHLPALRSSPYGKRILSRTNLKK